MKQASRQSRALASVHRYSPWPYPVRYPIRNLVSAVVLVHVFIRVFPAALHDPRADEKRSSFGFEGRSALHCAGQLLVCWPSGVRDGRDPLMLCRELLRCQVAETRVRPFPVIVDPPLFDLTPRIVERDQDVLAEALLAQPAVEALDGGISFTPWSYAHWSRTRPRSSGPLSA